MLTSTTATQLYAMSYRDGMVPSAYWADCHATRTASRNHYWRCPSFFMPKTAD